jgi:enamine deaminase RidA (YjgF/YER057c/UK114 family)
MGTARGLHNNIIGSRITNERTLEMSDFPNSSAGGAGSVRYINPDSLNKNPAFTNVVVEGNVRTVHIGGQDALNASGEIVGKGDIVAQIEQILANLRAALAAGGAEPEHIIKWTASYHGGVRLGSCASGLLGGDGRRRCRAAVGREPNFRERLFHALR